MWMIQMSASWHREGLFMGMHGLWWLFWILTIVIVLWAFSRLLGDGRDQAREERQRTTVEEILRRRFGEGTIGEEEFLRRMHLLHESRPPASREGRTA
ncbi:MAG: hypothetical protein Q8W51_01205 [Candidatus Palauibacterales bacterium]|nr:hypothetical protein [Candidatus Palauibacterales bacterium]MDP2528337.1 hypothetical protein [Candidatus Palauibacterales bacterium]MDP2584375.1 hypothetical protein [Candidatus Palauibacterales bacterium]